MNKQPVYYLQTDPRWSKELYQVPGEHTTIGESGCGPSCAAMLIETLTGKRYTPLDACKWSLAHGYKALKHGTYYSYFQPQFKAFGIEARQLNSDKIYNQSSSKFHDIAFSYLKSGYYLIVCMGPGTWTKSGHFVVVWWEDGKVRINDPASRKEARINGDLETFKRQVKYYFVVDGTEFNKEEEDVTSEEVLKMINENQPKVYTAKEQIPAWFQNAVDWGLVSGVIKGDQNGSLYLTEDNLISLQMLYNYANRKGNS